MNRNLSCLPVSLLLLFSLSNVHAQSSKDWSIEFTGMGIHSSPRTADLNGDGVKDIVIGCSKKEFEPQDSAIIAIDGRNGKMLWKAAARDQIYGSASFLDINHDGTPDVIIGGRAAELKALNGKNGQLLWAFYPKGNSMQPRKDGWYNFYNPQIIPDQNGDKLQDILVSNGGDILAKPHDPRRPTGNLLVLDGSNGKILAKAPVPDDKETYLSVVISKISENDSDYTVIFGTGGETIGGHLFRTTLKDIMKQDISAATVLYTSKDKGFIAPPALLDLNGDHFLDIVDNAVEGKTIAIDGKTNQVLWEKSMQNTEVYGSLGVGYFNDDNIPDLFTTYTKGQWPKLNESQQIMMNGKTGGIEFIDSLGILQTTSPVVADFNNDGYDDGLMEINFTVVEKEIFSFYHTMLVVYDFHNQSTFQLTGDVPGINLSSSLWTGDLDNDGKLDVIYCYLTDTKKKRP